MQQLAVDADVVAASVGLGSKNGDHLAIDLYAALLDQGLGAAAAGDAGSGENLLQSLELGWRARLGVRLGFSVVFGSVFGVSFDGGVNCGFNLRFGGF